MLKEGNRLTEDLYLRGASRKWIDADDGDVMDYTLNILIYFALLRHNQKKNMKKNID